MTYSDALNFLVQQLPMYQRVGPKAFKKDLGNIQQLCARLGNPERGLKCIHIAGTNGKGSTTHILASILIEQGYRIGLYTSPHYVDFRERIKIGDTYIPENEVIEFVKWYKDHALDIKASFFELTVALAFWYFKVQEVDYVVLETGLGGRLDSTNVVTPLISVITNIGLDHTNFLGDTKALIAAEKAGIIKQNVPVVIGTYDQETWPVFQQFAKAQKAPIQLAADLVSISNVELATEGIKFQVQIEDMQFDVQSDLNGNYQIENMRTGMAAYLVFTQQTKIAFEPTLVQAGLSYVHRNTGMLGRWMQIQAAPMVVLDSAHNSAGMEQVLAQLNQTDYARLHVIFAVVGDKDIDAVMELLPQQAYYYLSQAKIPRALPVVDLVEKAKQHNWNYQAFSSIAEAYEAALAAAAPNDLVLVAGSVFTVAEVLEKVN